MVHMHTFQSYRPIASAPAQHYCDTYMYHFMIYTSRYKGTGTSAGTPAPAAGHAPARIPYHPRPLTCAPAQHFELNICIIVWYVCIAIEGRGVKAGAPAPATGRARAHIPTIIDR